MSVCVLFKLKQMINAFRDIYDIYMTPDNYSTRLDDRMVEFKDSIFRREFFREYFEYRFINPDRSITLLIFPLTQKVCDHLCDIESTIKRLNTSLFGDFQLVRAEVYSKEPPLGAKRKYVRKGVETKLHSMEIDFAIQTLPPSVMFADHVDRIPRSDIDTIFDAINNLETYLSLRSIQLGRVSELDFVVGEMGELYPCNLIGLSVNTMADNSQTVDTLKKWVAYIRGIVAPLPNPLDDELTELENSSYTHNTTLYPGHIECGVFFEQRARIKHDSGYGFIDEQNNIVIKPIYRWCDYFCESRVKVRSEEGYGLLDPWGDHVIDPIFHELIFDPNTTLSVVRYGERWAYFSYTGQQLTSFKKRYIEPGVTIAQVLLFEDYIPDSVVTAKRPVNIY